MLREVLVLRRGTPNLLLQPNKLPGAPNKSFVPLIIPLLRRKIQRFKVSTVRKPHQYTSRRSTRPFISYSLIVRKQKDATNSKSFCSNESRTFAVLALHVAAAMYVTNEKAHYVRTRVWRKSDQILRHGTILLDHVVIDKVE